MSALKKLTKEGKIIYENLLLIANRHGYSKQWPLEVMIQKIKNNNKLITLD